MGTVARGGLSQKVVQCGVCGQVYNEMSSPRARLEGALTAAAQSFSTPSSPRAHFSPAQAAFVLESSGAAWPGNFHQDRAHFPELFRTVLALWKLSSSDLLHIVVYLTAPLQPRVLPLR